jgi:hypothetical protein
MRLISRAQLVELAEDLGMSGWGYYSSACWIHRLNSDRTVANVPRAREELAHRLCPDRRFVPDCGPIDKA